jgi:hypothetical protein
LSHYLTRRRDLGSWRRQNLHDDAVDFLAKAEIVKRAIDSQGMNVLYFAAERDKNAQEDAVAGSRRMIDDVNELRDITKKITLIVRDSLRQTIEDTYDAAVEAARRLERLFADLHDPDTDFPTAESIAVVGLYSAQLRECTRQIRVRLGSERRWKISRWRSLHLHVARGNPFR